MSPRDHVPSTRTLHRIRTMFLPKWVTSRKPSRLYILIDPVYCGWEVPGTSGETPQQPRLPACECSPLLNAARISPSPHEVGGPRDRMNPCVFKVCSIKLRRTAWSASIAQSYRITWHLNQLKITA